MLPHRSMGRVTMNDRMNPPEPRRMAGPATAGIFGAVLGALALLAPSAAQAVSPPPVHAATAMVVTAQHLASDVGVAILKEGGNAVDAAVAVGYAEAVVHPCCGNIGGGGFMLLHLKDKGDVVVDFREMAPGAATANMYLDKNGNPVPYASILGFKAVGVPGTVLGLETARAKYGRLSRAQDMAPAIRLARQGYVLTEGDAAIFSLVSRRFRNSPELAKIFLRPDGSPLKAGDRLVQKDLAGTLEHIAWQGPDYFYHGPVAKAIVAASQKGGGILSLADFAHYRPDIAKPVSCNYRGYTVLSVAPPSSGGVTMCEILNILSFYDLKAMGFHSAAATRLMVEAMRYAYADRNDKLGDPAFVHNPIAHLLSMDYAASIRKKIDTTKIAPMPEPAATGEKPETTHYSIVDKDGNAASVTYTLNGYFGAMEMAPGTGVTLNDEMDDFTTKPGVPNMFGLVQGTANAIAPGKRPLSSMSPTIVLKDGKPFLVLGSPGGSRIITATLESIVNVIDYGMDAQEAIDAPRIHYQGLPNVVYLEPFALSADTRKVLEGEGYRFLQQPHWCAVEMIAVGPDGLYGANDDRRPAGAAKGY